jgi:hypothetical protein
LGDYWRTSVRLLFYDFVCFLFIGCPSLSHS